MLMGALKPTKLSKILHQLALPFCMVTGEREELWLLTGCEPQAREVLAIETGTGGFSVVHRGGSPRRDDGNQGLRRERAPSISGLWISMSMEQTGNFQTGKALQRLMCDKRPEKQTANRAGLSTVLPRGVKLSGVLVSSSVKAESELPLLRGLESRDCGRKV